MAPANEPLRACAKTATNTTIARPIMRAAAVAAVRDGLRPAFSRARRPLVGASRSSGQPSTRLSGRTTYLDAMAMPTKSSSAPSPMMARRPPAVAVADEAEDEGPDAEHGDRAPRPGC